MRDSFVGDIGDFANYGLLRALSGTPTKPMHDLKLGVLEYLTKSNDEEQENGQGSIIGYLKVSKHNNLTFRKCDEELYDDFREMVGKSLVDGNELRVCATRARLFLPLGDHYYDSLVLNKSKKMRKEWLEAALAKLQEDTDILFLNPDNGIALTGAYLA